jgi:hypothetical protein
MLRALVILVFSLSLSASAWAGNWNKKANKEITVPIVKLETVSNPRPNRKITLFDFKSASKSYKADKKAADYYCRYSAIALTEIMPNTGKVFGHGTKYTILNQPNPFTDDIRFVQSRINAFLRYGNASELDGLKRWMLASAAAKSYMVVVPDSDRYHLMDPVWNLRQVATALMVGTEALIQTNMINTDEKQHILDWLNSINTFAKKTGDNGKGTPHNVGTHSMFFDHIHRMMWASMIGDKSDIKVGVRLYKATIDTLKATGATLEVGRLKQKNEGLDEFGGRGVVTGKGWRSLRKMNEVVGGLVVMAELAMPFGINLYDYSNGKKSLRYALKYFVENLENTTSLQKEVSPEKPLDLWFQYEGEHNDASMAWVYYLIKRFPDEKLVNRLANLIRSDWPQMGTSFGGSVGCYLGLTALRQ